MTCSIDDCDRPFYGRTWCRLHWDRWRRHGDPLFVASRPPKRPCKVDGCENSSRIQELCRKHYQRLRKTGAPEGVRTKPLEERFWAKVRRGAPDECWEWQGGRYELGYGRFALPGKRHGRAHCFSYELAYGPAPAGMYILHSCDNPPCVNPAHLSAGPQTENMAQMVARGRRKRRFSDEVLAAVRDSAEPQKKLAESFGMSQSYVSLIKRQYRDGMNRSFTA
ncbi:HNH endonuclease [Streptosporangium sp. DT93]|uniref:HNH endonuclease n=1 Tax=Streptosporangium sp. DT93 TaxID=3393428 RepID=UPI003CF4F4ED